MAENVSVYVGTVVMLPHNWRGLFRYWETSLESVSQLGVKYGTSGTTS